MFQLPTPKRYGLSYQPTTGTFAGTRIPYTITHGIAGTFDSRQAALREATRIFGSYCQRFNVQAIPEADCQQLAEQLVEYYTGRRIISNGKFVVHNEAKPSYHDVKQYLQDAHYTTPLQEFA